MCKKKLKNFIELFFLKNFFGWLLLSLIIFFITIPLNYSIEYKLIFFGLILAFGSLVYNWKQMQELFKSPDLNLFLSFEGELLKEVTLKKNKMSAIEIVANNKGNKIADKFAFLLAFEKIEGLEYHMDTVGFYSYDEKRNGKEFLRLENNSKNINFIFPSFSHSLGTLYLKYSQKPISSHIIEYTMLANDMCLKKGELKIHIK